MKHAQDPIVDTTASGYLRSNLHMITAAHPLICSRLARQRFSAISRDVVMQLQLKCDSCKLARLVCLQNQGYEHGERRTDLLQVRGLESHQTVRRTED